MRTILLTSLALVAGFLMVGGPMLAHHGTRISYDLTPPPIMFKGTVTEFRWRNPHVAIFVDAEDENGNIVNWSIEGNSPYNWAQQGWNKRTLTPGEEVTISLYNSKIAGRPAGVIHKVILADGREVLRFQRDFEPGGTREVR